MGEIAVQNGQRIVFLGDSITQEGWDHPQGYVRLVVLGLRANGIGITPIPTGEPGNKSTDMLARLERDVLANKPDWMMLSCGINDVWHGWRGVRLKKFQTHLRSIVERTQAAAIKIMILTTTVIGEELNNAPNRKLSAYNDFLRLLAFEKRCFLADVNADLHRTIEGRRSDEKTAQWVTRDGVHLNRRGNQTVANCILHSFGLDSSQMRIAQEAWKKIE